MADVVFLSFVMNFPYEMTFLWIPWASAGTSWTKQKSPQNPFVRGYDISRKFRLFDLCSKCRFHRLYDRQSHHMCNTISQRLVVDTCSLHLSLHILLKWHAPFKSFSDLFAVQTPFLGGEYDTYWGHHSKEFCPYFQVFKPTSTTEVSEQRTYGLMIAETLQNTY